MKKISGSDLNSFLLRRLLLIFNIGLFAYWGVFSQSATITPSSMLNEVNLDAEYITVTLGDGETFINYLNLKIDSFALVGAPPGTFIESVTGISATITQIDLGYDGTDFDIEYPYFHILIKNTVLSLSTEDLATDSISINYALEPVITNVSIPNDTMRIGTIVNVTISVENDEGSTFSLEGGSEIGGHPLTNLIRINDTIYTCNFTVVEGGYDFAASENIPVQIRLLKNEISGNLYTDPIIQDSDLLDANSPVIQIIYTTNVGAQSIGDEIFIRIQTDGFDYNFTPTSNVNNIPLTSSSINIFPIGSGVYHLRYVVQAGDANVNPGELTLSMIAVDLAGNLSLPFTTLAPNDLSIDASRPIITRAYLSSTDEIYIPKDTIVINVVADQELYRNYEDTWINGVHIGPYLTFRDLGGGLYKYSYIVQEQDGVVLARNFAINIVLQDLEPYENTSFPFTDLELPWIPPDPAPYAIVSGSTEICYGKSAPINVELVGTPPFWFVIFDGITTDTIYSFQSQVQLLTKPLSTTNYTVPKVVDSTGNTGVGYGNALITVHPLPVVQILNLDGFYSVTSPPVALEYTPLGGTFTGPGISDSPWTFDPEIAGGSSDNSPHRIEYTFTDSNSCTSSDIKEVIVVPGSGFITFEKSNACYYDSTFLIIGTNETETAGSFTIQPSPPEGFFTDMGNDTAILKPILYKLSADSILTVTYTFLDSTGSEISIQRPLTIEYLEDAEIYPLSSDNFCQNEDPIKLTGYPVGGIFSGKGISGNVQDGFWFEPSQANLDTNIIQYIYTSDNGCSVQDSVDFIINFAPVANFTTTNSCVSETGGLIQFENLPDTGNFEVESWKWNFEYPSEDEENISDLRNPSHFYENGHWTVKLAVEIDNGCTDSTEKTITLNPTYELSPDRPYLEDFEDSLHEWTSISIDLYYQNSWTYGEVDSTNFPWNASSGTMAWYTDRSVAQTPEISSVLSPCFNFENFYRPMVSLDIKRSLDRNNDGATLQYTIDNGQNWITLGGIGDGGINWYNSDSIWNGPGKQKTGWTGDQDFSEDSKWYKAAYWLDELTGHDKVQFRIAFSSNGDSTNTCSGFAFDNFTLKQRTRLSVLEYFTNANTPECHDADLEVCKIMKQAPDDVIDIQYHAAGNQADNFYQDNPVPANNRGTVYGVIGIPYAILDGDFRTYGFESDYPNLKDIRMRSLMDPEFKLTIILTQYTPSLEFSIEIEALKDLERKERTLHTIVLQRQVFDPEYIGTNGIVGFLHVARKMVPDAGGTYLGRKAWTKGEIEYFELSYSSSFFPTHRDSITIVVFMQDDITGEILQAVTPPKYYMYDYWQSPEIHRIYMERINNMNNCETLTGLVETKSQVLLYPNPTREMVNVSFEGVTKEAMQFILYDLAGKIVISDIIEPWQQRYSKSLGDLEQGLYIVEIQTKKDKQIFYRGKLFHY